MMMMMMMEIRVNSVEPEIKQQIRVSSLYKSASFTADAVETSTENKQLRTLNLSHLLSLI